MKELVREQRKNKARTKNNTNLSSDFPISIKIDGLNSKQITLYQVCISQISHLVIQIGLCQTTD